LISQPSGQTFMSAEDPCWGELSGCRKLLETHSPCPLSSHISSMKANQTESRRNAIEVIVEVNRHLGHARTASGRLGEFSSALFRMIHPHLPPSA
jgi:hypothetical protein